jgi:threonine synthase
MEIVFLQCNVCSQSFKYPLTQPEHRHPDLEIGGVPINFWQAVYLLNMANLTQDANARGILKFRRMLPFEKAEIVSQDEGNTPLRRIDALSTNSQVFLKDESENPTGSFKDRGMPLLFAEAKLLNKEKAAIPSTGNAGISFVSYAQLAGIEPVVFLPSSAPREKIETMRQKATLVFDKDLIQSYEHFFDFCRHNEDAYNGFPATNTAYIQGLKTAAYEIYMQLNGNVPDWLILPCGSGGNIVGYFQGFQDLQRMGLIEKMPRFVSVQIAGADPITYGFERQIIDKTPILSNPVSSRAEAIASDTCFNYLKIQDILRVTSGLATSVTDEQIDRVNGFDGLEFSSRSVFPALVMIQGKIKQGETVVLVGTAKNRKELLV